MKAKRVESVLIIISAIALILSTIGCGKDVTINKKGTNLSNLSKIQSFAEELFEKNNLPYKVLSEVDVQNTTDEYLFYIKEGIVYQTINDYVVVIVERKYLHESENLVGKEYNEEVYNIFENDSIDVLKCCASGDYAMLCNVSCITDWKNDTLVNAFMKLAKEKSEKSIE